MQFVIEGTLEELKEHIRASAKAICRDIVIYQDAPTALQIGFLRLGKRGGRYFVADVTDENGRITLDGEIKNLPVGMPSVDTRSVWKKMRDALFGLLVLYVFLALIPWAVWDIFDIPHLWIPFFIPVAVIVLFCLLSLLKGRKKNFEEVDRRFLNFMEMISSGEVTLPSNSKELYNMLVNAAGLHSLPQLKDDVITWELYKNAYVKASISEYDTIIEVLHKRLVSSSIHWHPDLEEMYEELYNLGKKGTVLVLRKSIYGTQIYYIGEPEKYRFSPAKKWHWGKLIYLEQK